MTPHFAQHLITPIFIWMGIALLALSCTASSSQASQPPSLDAYWAAGDWPNVIRLLESDSSRDQGKLYAAYVNYAEALRQAGRKAEATDVLNKARILDPNRREAPAALEALQETVDSLRPYWSPPPKLPGLCADDRTLYNAANQAFQFWLSRGYLGIEVYYHGAELGQDACPNNLIWDRNVQSGVTRWNAAGTTVAINPGLPPKCTAAVVAHEFGHLFGLQHSMSGLMAPVVTDMMCTPPPWPLDPRPAVIPAPQEPLREGDLVKGSDPAIYLIERGQRRHIPDPQTFDRMGFNWGSVRTLGDSRLNAIPEGPPLPRR